MSGFANCLCKYIDPFCLIWGFFFLKDLFCGSVLVGAGKVIIIGTWRSLRPAMREKRLLISH